LVIFGATGGVGSWVLKYLKDALEDTKERKPHQGQEMGEQDHHMDEGEPDKRGKKREREEEEEEEGAGWNDKKGEQRGWGEGARGAGEGIEGEGEGEGEGEKEGLKKALRFKVRLVVRSRERAEQLFSSLGILSPSFELFEGNVTDPASVADALQGATLVLSALGVGYAVDGGPNKTGISRSFFFHAFMT